MHGGEKLMEESENTVSNFCTALSVSVKAGKKYLPLFACFLTLGIWSIYACIAEKSLIDTILIGSIALTGNMATGRLWRNDIRATLNELEAQRGKR